MSDSNLNQIWADEMNGKVPSGTYRKILEEHYISNVNSPRELEIKIARIEGERDALECQVEEQQERIKHLEDALRKTIKIVDDTVRSCVCICGKEYDEARSVLEMAQEALNEKV